MEANGSWCNDFVGLYSSTVIEKKGTSHIQIDAQEECSLFKGRNMSPTCALGNRFFLKHFFTSSSFSISVVERVREKEAQMFPL